MTGRAFEFAWPAGTFQLLVRELETLIAITTLTFDNFTVTTKGNEMAYTLPVDKQVRVKVAYVDSHGNPATIDGDVTWGTSDPSVAEVTADPDDSFEAVVRPAGATGQAQVVARCDADLGSGTRELNTLMDVTVVAGEAIAGTISPVGDAEPVDQVEHRKK